MYIKTKFRFIGQNDTIWYFVCMLKQLELIAIKNCLQYAVKVRRHTPWSRVCCHGSHSCWFTHRQFHSQFHSRRHSLRITLKYTTLACMCSSNTWTMKPWQRGEWRLGFNSVLGREGRSDQHVLKGLNHPDWTNTNRQLPEFALLAFCLWLVWNTGNEIVKSRSCQANNYGMPFDHIGYWLKFEYDFSHFMMSLPSE